jgi:hypothetical protein
MMAQEFRLVVQIAARGGVGAKLETGLRETAGWLERRAGVGRTGLLLRVPDDPFASANPGMRGFDATLELCGIPASSLEPVFGALDGLGERLARIAHVDLSAALIGIDHRIVPSPADPVRYQYAMRRRADLSHAQYVDHYLTVHAEFGRRQPGVLGYTQFHVDPALARRAAASAGVGVWAFDSISELHLESLRAFTDALARMPREAVEAPLRDEENFVDRASSVSFVTRALGS